MCDLEYSKYFVADNISMKVLSPTGVYVNVRSYGFEDFNYPDVQIENLQICDVETVGSFIFKKVNFLTFSDSVKELKPEFSHRATSVQHITMPNFVEKIHPSFLKDSKDLNVIKFPATSIIKEFPPNFLCGRSSLKFFDVPMSVEKIYHNFMFNCESLEEVRFLNKDTNITVESFYGCPNLKLISSANPRKSITGENIKIFTETKTDPADLSEKDFESILTPVFLFITFFGR